MGKKSDVFWILGILCGMLFLGGCGGSGGDEIVIGCGTIELIDAIDDANANPNHTTIQLNEDCVYTLTQVNNTQNGANGLPLITTPITIVGNDAQIIRSDTQGTPEFRIFYILGGELTLSNLSVENGSMQLAGGIDDLGGAIYNHQGVLTLQQSQVENNMGGDMGGGIYNFEGTVSLINSSVSFNSAGIGGGIYNDLGTIVIGGNSFINYNNAPGDGGGIYNQGELTIQNSNVKYNQAGENGGGIYHHSLSSLILDEVTLEGNEAQGIGGAVRTRVGSGSFLITGCTFDGNYAAEEGGALFIQNEGTIIGSMLRNNSADYGGGAIYIEPGDVTIENSTIIDNDSGYYGGGINNEGELTILNSTIANNTAVRGGGIESPVTLFVVGSTISGNIASEQGGGISEGGWYLSQFEMLNSTVSGNQAPASAGILLRVSPNVANISFSTIANNISQNGSGGVFVEEGYLVFKNSIIADNQPVDCGGILGNNVAAQGGNLDSDGSCPGFTITGIPLLLPLAGNGGSTDTHALDILSPAIDAAITCNKFGSAQTLVTEDQRGVGRPKPVGGYCDLGAYEANYQLRFEFTRTTTCFIWPDANSLILTTFEPGQEANAIGRNEDGTWLAVNVGAVGEEGGEEARVCWVPDQDLVKDFDTGDLPLLDLREFQPRDVAPVVVPEEPEPDKEFAGCWWEPLGGAKECKVPCPNDEYSGKPCNP